MRLDYLLAAIIFGDHAISPCRAARCEQRAAGTSYAPQPATCPATPIVRQASSLAASEFQYISARKPVADAALASWLKQVNNKFDTSALPIVALAGSGGGYRALLNEAGIIQAMDSRDSNSSVKGLYQALCYHSALSGGGWLAQSLAAWNWPTISFLRENVYEPRLQNSLILAGGFNVAFAYAQIVGDVNRSLILFVDTSQLADVTAKAAALYPVTIGDIYGRLLGYNLFPGPDGGAALTMSGLTTFSNFTAHRVPYPIITSIGTNASSSGNCSAPPDAIQYEYTPHEFGSWDKGADSFVQMAYLGSSLSNGVVAQGKRCTRGFDRLDFVTASTSNIFGFLCNPLYAGATAFAQLADALQNALLEAAGIATTELFNVIPNPFRGYSRATAVAGAKFLTLGDGDLSLQNNPIYPFLQPERNVSILVVAETCNENATNSLCTGLSLHNTYLQSKVQGLPRMPTIPPESTFIAQNLGNRARFFGCHQPNTLTIIWLPLVAYSSTVAQDVSTFDIQIDEETTDAAISNGNLIATQGDDPQWPMCLACAIMTKSGRPLLAGCDACLDKYCV
ncbi:hypothetical protein LTR56_013618 [Elasticomyces elasticus]|nr:hypothetical protein LTR22_018430 [Elasticomyces elasticus]KAK3637445.1 hypothetical protein LTR56_013618 [Elasticomyces elasticus]KAK4917896.1 hypothetical protein LTR49_014300 [Elasticomyces elasticus]KAK5757055.1 hypothetical protein LTS12_012869 [Elasticomyces elasticus]